LVLIKFMRLEYAIAAWLLLVLTARFWRYLREIKQENLFIFLSHALADFSIILTAILLSR
jgi:hypothetical protein